MRFEAHLTLDGPFLTAGLDQAGFRVDATRARDADGKPTLPWSHLRGHLRECVVELLTTHRPELSVADAERAASVLFGAPDAKKVPGRRSAVRPLSLTLKGPNDGQLAERDLTWQVSLDPHTGTARERHLTTRETGHTGDEWNVDVVFTAAPTGGLTADQTRAVLLAALHWMRGFGKGGQHGWGRITGRTVTVDGAAAELRGLSHDALAKALDKLLAPDDVSGPSLPTTAPIPQPVAGATALRARITLQGPLAVGDGRRGSNVHSTRTDIPGSVLRRALADLLLAAAGKPPGGWLDAATPFRDAAYGLTPAELSAVARAFSDVHVGFALPAPTPDAAPAEPVPITTFAGVDRYEALLRGDVEGLDDKEHALDGGWSGHAFVTTRLTAHVAKDRTSGAARQGMLYVVRAIAPVWDGQPATFVVDVQAPPAVAPLVARLLPHVTHLGKAIGRGYGHVQVAVDGAPPAPPPLRAGPCEARLVVRTEALWLRREQAELGADNVTLYTAALRDMLKVDVTVTHAFAHHRLRGGVTAGGPHAVPPAVITLPGTVLRLTWPAAADKAARDALARAAAHGLQRDAAVDDLQALWKRPCPYVRANGYGAVTLDQPSEPA